jgi:hypothetical protein
MKYHKNPRFHMGLQFSVAYHFSRPSGEKKLLVLNLKPNHFHFHFLIFHPPQKQRFSGKAVAGEKLKLTIVSYIDRLRRCKCIREPLAPKGASSQVLGPARLPFAPLCSLLVD